jgi:hypothetical protein
MRIGELAERAGVSRDRVLRCACDSLDRCTCGAAYHARAGRDPGPQPGELLHVTNGESAGSTLRRTSLGGAVLPWQDVLAEGPVPALPPAELRRTRARFLSACGWGGTRTILHALERRDRLLELALGERRRLVLWFEHDLHDQLHLLQILARTAETGFDSERLELINVGSFEGRPGFRGLGELGADELESLWPLRRPVTTELAALGSLGWTAVTAPDPAEIEAFLARDTSGLPFLADALRRLLEELPDAHNGLARSERHLLELLRDGARRPPELFVAAQDLEEAPFAGDSWVWRRLAELAAGPRALLARADGGPFLPPPPIGDGPAFAAMQLTLTESGRTVLAGAADRVELLGIDRWVGGTHLRPEQAPRWDRGAGRVVDAG